MMECDICEKEHHPQHRPFLCTMDARNRCYQGRVDNARALMENEVLQSRIDQMLVDANEMVSSSTGSGGGVRASLNSSLLMELSISEQRTVEERTSQIIRRAEELKGDIAKARQDIDVRTKVLARRRNDLDSASEGIEQRRARRLSDVGVVTDRARTRWADVSDDTANHRGFLCTEAAKLYGLCRVSVRGPQRYEYRIGKVEAISLTNLGAHDPDVVSTSLAHIAHILVLASQYLAIRLPAVVTIPHRDHPRPTIFSLASSYRYADTPLMGSYGSMAGWGGTQSASQKHPPPPHIPRPRPLYLEKPIGVLAKEDPAAFGFFVEGVTLLAYDVAWACASQGIPVVVSENTAFADMCHLGRNLWMLLLLQNPSTPSRNPSRKPTNQTTPVRSISQQGMMALSNSGNGETTDAEQAAPEMTTYGRFSHGTANAFLGSAEGHEHMRSFRLPAPMTMADELKKRLLSECVTDWEVVQDEAWDLDGATEPAVLVGARKPQGVKNSNAEGGGDDSGDGPKLRVGRDDGGSAADNSGTRQPGVGASNVSSSSAGSGAGSAGANGLVGGARSRWTILRGFRG